MENGSLNDLQPKIITEENQLDPVDFPVVRLKANKTLQFTDGKD